VEDVLELMAGEAHRKQVELSLLFGQDIPRWVGGDPSRLRQILTNLVSNAVKFTENGEVLVSVAVTSDNENIAPGQPVALRFDVSDTGIGMDADAQNRIFEAFSQADGSTTRKFGGTGLGLAICKQLAALMGGEIGVQSEVGRGSNFWFTVICEAVDAPPSRQDEAMESLKGIRTIYIDDNAANRAILKQQLQSRGLIVQTFDTPIAGLAFVKDMAAELDLVVLDYHMPGMDGLEVARQIRAHPGTAHLKLFMLSSIGLAGRRSAARTAGIDGYLTKPARQSQLYQSLADVLAGTQPLKSERRIGREDKSKLEQWSARVLVAEDTAINQRVIRRMLEKHGLTVDMVGNGLEAVQATAEIEYDLIFMDCQMPTMDGYEATQSIREREEKGGGHTPIIALTANAMRGDRERCLEAGMDDYLPKPIRRPDLPPILSKWISDTGQPRVASG
nr:response regulator [Gammaproteobacteria bacterium]